MPRKEEEKEEFEPAMSRSERRKLKRTPKETTPTPKPTKPDKIGGQDETARKMGPEDRPSGQKSYADATAEPDSSSAKAKNP